jgi:hypothetical protein
MKNYFIERHRELKECTCNLKKLAIARGFSDSLKERCEAWYIFIIEKSKEVGEPFCVLASAEVASLWESGCTCCFSSPTPPSHGEIVYCGMAAGRFKIYKSLDVQKDKMFIYGPDGMIMVTVEDIWDEC